MDSYSLRDVHYTGYSDSIFLPLLEINSDSLPRIDQEVLTEVFFFPFNHRQPTDQRSVVGDYRRKIRKERGQKERKKKEKELCQLTTSVKLKIL